MRSSNSCSTPALSSRLVPSLIRRGHPTTSCGSTQRALAPCYMMQCSVCAVLSRQALLHTDRQVHSHLCSCCARHTPSTVTFHRSRILLHARPRRGRGSRPRNVSEARGCLFFDRLVRCTRCMDVLAHVCSIPLAISIRHAGPGVAMAWVTWAWRTVQAVSAHATCPGVWREQRTSFSTSQSIHFATAIGNNVQYACNAVHNATCCS